MTKNNTQILIGDVRETLKQLPDNSVNCCVTSPPYFALRNYGTSQWEGGDPDCDHVADESKTKVFGNPEFNQDRPSREKIKINGYYFKDVCGKCGAINNDTQIGVEETPDEYIKNMVDVFREVKRVLR